MNIFLRLLYSSCAGLVVGYLGFVATVLVFMAVGWEADDKATMVQQWVYAVITGGILGILAFVGVLLKLRRKK